MVKVYKYMYLKSSRHNQDNGCFPDHYNVDQFLPLTFMSANNFLGINVNLPSDTRSQEENFLCQITLKFIHS